MIKMSFIFLALYFTTNLSHAEDVMAVLKPAQQQFFIDSWLDYGGRVYYKCDSVESEVKNLLKKMGAQNIRVRCYGGIKSYPGAPALDAQVSLKFSAFKLAGEDLNGQKVTWTPVSIRTFDNCHLLRQVFNRVKTKFSLKNVQGPNSCMSAAVQTFRVSFETLKAL